MSDISISDEDRERLVNLKFMELLDKALDDPKIFDKLAARVIAHATNRQGQQQGQPQPTPNQVPAPPTASQSSRKRSAFEIFLGDAIGVK